MTDFAADVRKFVEKASDKADKFVVQFTQELGREVVELSPVDTGFFRSSWVGSIGTPNTTETGGGSDFTAILSGKAGDTLFINNNVPYARRLEYGYSNQAPNGMVRITLAKANQIAQNVLSKVAR